MPVCENAVLAQSDAELAELLARCFLQPSPDFALEVKGGSLTRALREILGECSDSEIRAALDDAESFACDLSALDEQAAYLKLEADYNRLFVGPGKLLAPPYESVHATRDGLEGRGRLRGPAEREVHAAYVASGYDMPERFVEYPDHIAVELEFLAMLAAQEAEAWEQGDESAAFELQERADAFREEHLGRWLPSFAEEVRSGAKLPFYASVATLARKTMLASGE